MIRFKRDDGTDYPDWEEVSVKEILDKQGVPVSVQKNEKYREIGIRSHGKGLFYKDEITGEDLGNKRVFKIEPDCLILNIVFAWERAVARTTENEVGMIASHRFPMYKPKDGRLDLDYIVKFLITDKGKEILELASPGGAGRNRTLGQKEFANSKLMLPCYEEQLKIAEFLSFIDKVIKESESEVKTLETLKKGVLQKLFNQEVRFDDNGKEYPEWEEVTFGDVIQYEQPTKYIVQDDDYEGKSTYPVLTANKAFILGYTDEETGVYDKGKVIIFDDFTCDSKFVNFPFKVKSSAMKMLTPKRNDVIEVLYELLKHLNQQPLGHQRHWISVFQPTITYLPCIEEQLKIANLISEFNTAIEESKKELEQWKLFKKGLLQQMFE